MTDTDVRTSRREVVTTKKSGMGRLALMLLAIAIAIGLIYGLVMAYGSTVSPSDTAATAKTGDPYVAQIQLLQDNSVVPGGGTVHGPVTVSVKLSKNGANYDIGAANVNTASVDYVVAGQAANKATASPYNYTWDTTKYTDGNNVLVEATVHFNGTTPDAKASIMVNVKNQGVAASSGSSASSSSSSSGSNASATAEDAPLYEVGPGDCVPGAQIVKDNPRKSGESDVQWRTRIKGLFINWVGDHSNSACVVQMAKSVNVAPAKFAAWLKNNTVLQHVGGDGMTVQNTYFAHHSNGAVTIENWKVQNLPAAELVFFSKNTGNALFKFVCGNRLHELPKKPSTPTTPSTPKTPPVKTPPVKTCEDTNSCGGTPPPPSCTKPSGCTPPTCTSGNGCTPPPTCENGGKKDCTPPPTCENGGKKDCTPPPSECTQTSPPGNNGSGYVWDQGTCSWTKSQPQECLLNPQHPDCPQPAAGQDVQDNSTSGVNTGKTPGASDTAPVDNTKPGNPGGKASDPTDNGSNSGKSDGSATDTGSSSDGQSGHPSTGSVSNANGGNNGTDGTSSTGNGNIPMPTDT